MKSLAAADLAEAQAGSYYTILGTGDPISGWLTGYEKLLETHAVGKPTEWFRTTGSEVNRYAETTRRGPIHDKDRFPADLPMLLFPLDTLYVCRLAVFRLLMSDHWFDDLIENMRIRW